MTPGILSASSISGTNVRNPRGESIGDVKDLMIDWKNGKVVYAVLSFGGFLGIGEKLFAIPIEKFEFKSPDGEEFGVLDIDKAHLENAPGFDNDNWPANADYSFIDTVYSHYGYEPYSTRYPGTFR